MKLDEEHEQFRDSVRAMVAGHVTPIADELDRTQRFPRELVEVFGDMGLLQLALPEEYGGPGGDLLSACIAREEVARGGSVAMSQLASQNGIVIWGILASGSEELKRKFLPVLAKGRTLTCIAITESEAGSDPAMMRTRAVRDGADWIINGSKQFITLGGVASYALVFARTNEAPRSKGISAFLVDTSQKGWVVARDNEKMGQRGFPVSDIILNNVRVPDAMLVGSEGQGFRSILNSLHLNRPTVAAMAVGVAECALDYAIGYAKQHTTGGSKVADFQGIRWMIADCATAIKAGRNLVYSAALAHDSGAPEVEVTRLGSMAKLFCGDMANRVASDAVQILGGAGYMLDHPVERYMRDAKLLAIYEGTSQVQRNIIANKILGST